MAEATKTFTPEAVRALIENEVKEFADSGPATANDYASGWNAAVAQLEAWLLTAV